MSGWELLLQHDIFSLLGELCMVETLEMLWKVHSSFRWTITYYLKHARRLSLAAFCERPLIVHLLSQPTQVRSFTIRQPTLISPTASWLETFIKSNCRTLTRLDFKNWSKDHRIFEAVSHCSQLKQLILPTTTQPTERLLTIFQNCHKLQHLSLVIPQYAGNQRALSILGGILGCAVSLRRLFVEGFSPHLSFLLRQIDTLKKIHLVIDDDTWVFLMFLQDQFHSWPQLRNIVVMKRGHPISFEDVLDFLLVTPASCLLPRTLQTLSIPVFIPLKATDLLTLNYVEVDYMTLSSFNQIIGSIPSLQTVLINSRLILDPVINPVICMTVPSLTNLHISDQDSRINCLVETLLKCIHLRELKLDMVWPSSQGLQQMLRTCSELKHLVLSGSCTKWDHHDDDILHLPVLTVLVLFPLHAPFRFSTPRLSFCHFDGDEDISLDLSPLFSTSASTLKEVSLDQPFLLTFPLVPLSLTRINLRLASIETDSLVLLFRSVPLLTCLKIETVWTASLFPLIHASLVTKSLSFLRFINTVPTPFQLQLSDLDPFVEDKSLHTIELGCFEMSIQDQAAFVESTTTLQLRFISRSDHL